MLTHRVKKNLIYTNNNSHNGDIFVFIGIAYARFSRFTPHIIHDTNAALILTFLGRLRVIAVCPRYGGEGYDWWWGMPLHKGGAYPYARWGMPL